MLFLADGQRIGALSPGCLEEDIAARVPDILADGKPRILTFDMRAEDDLVWGQGAGCNGVIDVIVHAVSREMQAHLRHLQRDLAAGRPVLGLVRWNANADTLAYVFVNAAQQTYGQWTGDIPLQLKNSYLRRPTFGTPSAGMGEMTTVSGLSDPVFVRSYQPPPRLIVFGAGADARPLATLAAKTGFAVTVTDWRPALCQRDEFPDAQVLTVGFPGETVPRLRITERDHVVLMTHNFARDKEILGLLGGMRPRYLGVLGPRHRTARLFGGDIPAWVHAPMGLAIGAEGPDEIAVSVVAQLIQSWRMADERAVDLLGSEQVQHLRRLSGGGSE